MSPLSLSLRTRCKGRGGAIEERGFVVGYMVNVVLTLLVYRHGDKIQSGHEANLQQLGLDYLDMAIMHFPIGTANGKPEYDIVPTWQAMENLVAPGNAAIKGKARFIGISNFNVTQIQDLLKVAKIKPKVCQHIHSPQRFPFSVCLWAWRRFSELISTTGPSARAPPLPTAEQIRRLPPHRRHSHDRLRPPRRHQPCLPQRRHCRWPLHESRCPNPTPRKPRPRLHR